METDHLVDIIMLTEANIFKEICGENTKISEYLNVADVSFLFGVEKSILSWKGDRMIHKHKMPSMINSMPPSQMLFCYIIFLLFSTGVAVISRKNTVNSVRLAGPRSVRAPR